MLKKTLFHAAEGCHVNMSLGASVTFGPAKFSSFVKKFIILRWIDALWKGVLTAK